MLNEDENFHQTLIFSSCVALFITCVFIFYLFYYLIIRTKNNDKLLKLKDKKNGIKSKIGKRKKEEGKKNIKINEMTHNSTLSKDKITMREKTNGKKKYLSTSKSQIFEINQIKDNELKTEKADTLDKEKKGRKRSQKKLINKDTEAESESVTEDIESKKDSRKIEKKPSAKSFSSQSPDTLKEDETIAKKKTSKIFSAMTKKEIAEDKTVKEIIMTELGQKESSKNIKASLLGLSLKKRDTSSVVVYYTTPISNFEINSKENNQNVTNSNSKTEELGKKTSMASVFGAISAQPTISNINGSQGQIPEHYTLSNYYKENEKINSKNKT